MSENFLYKNSDLIVFNNKVISLANRIGPDKSSSLVIRNGLFSTETVIYTAQKEVIEDIQVVGLDSDITIVWRERDNKLFSESEFHYAKMNDEGVFSEHRVIECNDNNCKHALLLRAKVFGAGYLLLSIVSKTMKKIILTVYDLKDYSQVDSVTLSDTVAERYFTSQKIYDANIVLLTINDEVIYLQSILSSGTLRNYSISVDTVTGKIDVSTLFDFALENIGYHNCLIDEEKEVIIITYSGTETEENSIYAAKQKLFLTSPIGSVDVARISQTNGDYFRPFIIKKDDNYLIAWEGDNIHYTVIDDELDISEAEDTLNCEAPGHILLAESEGVVVSCQTENMLNREFGKSFLLRSLNQEL